MVITELIPGAGRGHLLHRPLRRAEQAQRCRHSDEHRDHAQRRQHHPRRLRVGLHAHDADRATRLTGQVFAIFIITVAAAEAAVALAMIIAIYRRSNTIDVGEIQPDALVVAEQSGSAPRQHRTPTRMATELEMVQYAWLIPALPLAALIIVLLVNAPAGASRTPTSATPAAAGWRRADGGHDDARQRPPTTPRTRTTPGMAVAAATTNTAGTTPFWARVSSVITIAAMAGAFVISRHHLLPVPHWQARPAGQHQTRDGVTLQLYDWFNFGPLQLSDRVPRRYADRDHAGRRHRRLAAGASLLDRLHGRRSRLLALLHRALALHRLDADSGARRQLPGALHRLGAGGPLVLPADRLLVRPGASRPADSEIRPIRRLPRSRRSSRRAWATSAS